MRILSKFVMSIIKKKMMIKEIKRQNINSFVGGLFSEFLNKNK